MLGIPAAQEMIMGPPSMQALGPPAPPAPIMRTRTMFVPYLDAVDRRIEYKAPITKSFLIDEAPVDTLDQAVAILQTKLNELLTTFAQYPIKLQLDNEKRPEFKYDWVMSTAEPTAKSGKRQSFLILAPNGQYLGKLQFQVSQKQVQEEAKPVAVEELTKELALAMALGEAIEDIKPTKKRGVQ